jgi:hypothetical protein
MDRQSSTKSAWQIVKTNTHLGVLTLLFGVVAGTHSAIANPSQSSDRLLIAQVENSKIIDSNSAVKVGDPATVKTNSLKSKTFDRDILKHNNDVIVPTDNTVFKGPKGPKPGRHDLNTPLINTPILNTPR